MVDPQARTPRTRYAGPACLAVAARADRGPFRPSGIRLGDPSDPSYASGHAYDPLGRRVSSLQGGPGASRTVGSFTHYDSLGFVDYVDDALSNRTAFAYDPFSGRRITVAVAGGGDPGPLSTTHTAYDPEGRVIATWGATYPVAYEYDAFGRMVAMATTRDSAHESVNLLTLLPQGLTLSDTSDPSYPSDLDTTRWLYHEPTGLLTNKVYADSKGTAYSYTPDGKLAQRTWARGITTSYEYAPCCGSLTNILYSDSTPSVTFAYDRLGRQTNAIQSSTGVPPVVYEYRYDSASLSLVEEILADGTILARQQDPLGRLAGISLSNPDTPTPPYALTYSYDAYGRFHAVSSSVDSVVSVANYSYLPGSHLRTGVTISNPDTPTLPYSHTLHYEPNRDRIAAVSNTWDSTLVSAFDYTNDALGRRTARLDAQPAQDPVQNVFGYNQRSEVDSALMGTNTYGYAYDPIGNRLVATNNAVATAYLANELNQYTNILRASVPSVVHILTYDEDGNMTATGDGWHYAWNGENRLILASNSEHVVTYAYDHQGRMMTKTVDGATRRYLWDEYNVVAEYTHTPTPPYAHTNYFVWGLDSSVPCKAPAASGACSPCTRPL